MALPFAQAAFLQGTPVVSVSRPGAATVPIFTTGAHLDPRRRPIHDLLNHALMPEFSTAVARGDARLQRHFFFATLATNAAILIPGALVLIFFGQQIVGLWTHGKIHPSFDLIAVMTAVMLVNGMWFPVSNLILAANRHATYSYIFLGAALCQRCALLPAVAVAGRDRRGSLTAGARLFHVHRRDAPRLRANPQAKRRGERARADIGSDMTRNVGSSTPGHSIPGRRPGRCKAVAGSAGMPRRSSIAPIIGLIARCPICRRSCASG